jgi:hypothetical protein
VTTDGPRIDPEERWRVLLVAVVVLAGCPGGAPNTADDVGSDAPGSPSRPTPSSTAVDTTPITRTSTPGGTETDAHPLTDGIRNESFVVGTRSNRIRYTVTSISRTDRVGGEFGIEADERFVVMGVTVTNLGDNITRVTADSFTVVADDGDRYPTDGQAMNADEDALLVRELGPNATVRGVLIFDVPPTRDSLRLRVTAPGSDTTRGGVSGLTRRPVSAITRRS